MFDLSPKPTPLQPLGHSVFKENDLSVFIKRDDLIHPFVSGNKWRKLKYNLIKAKQDNYNTVLSYGGAFSNHIYSLAAAGKQLNFQTIGIIRGEETFPLNPTLEFATGQGMQLYYMDRETYKKKYSGEVLNDLKDRFGRFFFIPEGGTNEMALPGVKELISEIEMPFDCIVTPVGTGGTLSGLIAGIGAEQKALGISALKGNTRLEATVENLLSDSGHTNSGNWEILHDYHHGGYAKVSRELALFIKDFELETNIPLDPVYTGKMLYALVDLAKKGYFEKGKTIIVLHTGGLQGNMGMKPLIDKLLNVQP